MGPPGVVAPIDHVALNVADGERAMVRYRDNLGLEPDRQRLPGPSAPLRRARSALRRAR